MYHLKVTGFEKADSAMTKVHFDREQFDLDHVRLNLDPFVLFVEKKKYYAGLFGKMDLDFDP
jgi:hypothetical protein